MARGSGALSPSAQESLSDYFRPRSRLKVSKERVLHFWWNLPVSWHQHLANSLVHAAGGLADSSSPVSRVRAPTRHCVRRSKIKFRSVHRSGEFIVSRTQAEHLCLGAIRPEVNAPRIEAGRANPGYRPRRTVRLAIRVRPRGECRLYRGDFEKGVNKAKVGRNSFRL